MSDFNTVYDELCARYGVQSVLDKVTARAAAKLLCRDDLSASGAAQVEALISRLPNQAKTATKEWDLRLLTDGQLRVLEKLAAIATGEKPAVPEHRQRSAGYWNFMDAARTVDAVEKRGGGMASITPYELIELKTAIAMGLSTLKTTILQFYREHWEQFLPKPATDLSPHEKTHHGPPQGQEATSEKPSNVVPLRNDSPWAGLAAVNGGGGGPPGVLFDADNPRGSSP